MEIMIDIPKDLYEKIESHNVPLSDIDVICQSILDGDIVYDEERECDPIEGVPLEELVNLKAGDYMKNIVFNKLRHAIDFSHLVGGRIKRCDDGTYIVRW